MAAKTPVKLGGVRARRNTGRERQDLEGGPRLPIQLVSGYKGTAEIRLAAASGELAGACWSWNRCGPTWRGALDTGEVVAVLQTSPRAFPDLPGVPLAINLAKTDEARQLIKVGIQNAAAFARPLALPPARPGIESSSCAEPFRKH